LESFKVHENDGGVEMATVIFVMVMVAGSVNGYAGYHWSEGLWNGHRYPISIGLGSVGVDAYPNDWMETSVSFIFFDLTKGSDFTSFYRPYLQEAWVKALFTQDISLVIGHQLFMYRDGFFLHDIGDGSDAIRLRVGYVDVGATGIDLFILRKGSVFFEPIQNPRDLIGFYASKEVHDGNMFDIYGGYLNEPPWRKYLGTRLDFKIKNFLIVLEIVGSRFKRNTAYSYQGYIRFFDLPSEGSSYGLGFYGFTHDWVKPISYPPIIDMFYNGWTGFGEAMNWVVMPFGLANYLSSAQLGDPYGVYWPDMHNLRVWNTNVYLPITDRVAFRFDYFLYGFDLAPKSAKGNSLIGQEIATNLQYQVGQGVISLAVGYLSPLSAMKNIGYSDPAIVFRLWGFIPFRLNLPEGLE